MQLSFEEINKIDWYHTIELPGGHTTNGRYDWRPYMSSIILLLGDLKGRTILDIGTGNGFFAFEFEKLGGIVTALDIPSQTQRDNNVIGVGNIERGKEYNNYDFALPFNIAQNALGSNVRRIEMNLYDITSEGIGTYDVVFCNDVLLHLSDPGRAVWAMKHVSNDRLVIGTPIIEDKLLSNKPLKNFKKAIRILMRKFGYLLLKGYPIAEYHGAGPNGEFWIPNMECLKELVRGAGFSRLQTTVIELRKEHNENSTSQNLRGFVIGSKK